MKVNRTFLNWLRILGMVEGVSTLILFTIAMPLKYFLGMPLAVTLAGSIHGFLFVALVTMFVIGIKRIPIPGALAAAGIAAAVFPFGPFIIDRRLSQLNHESWQ